MRPRALQVQRTTVAALLLSLLVAACTGEDAPAPQAPTAAPAAIATDALTALDEAAATTDPVTLAVTHFALLFGPVPGALDIEPDDTLPIGGSGAVAGIADVWEELDDEQRTAVRDHLRPWFDAATTATPIDLDEVALGARTAGPVATGTAAADPDDGHHLRAAAIHLARAPDDRITAELRDAARHVFGAIGGERPAGVLVQQADEALAAGDAVTRAGWLTAAAGVFELIFDEPITGRDCRMILGPVVADLGTAELRSLAAHEMFHCWSLVNSGSLTEHNRTPDWWQEGIAAWIGEAYAGGSGYSQHWWRLWLRPVEQRVTTTSYPAIGFWSWIDAAIGGGLLGQVDELHRVAVTGDSTALYAAATGALTDEQRTGLAASRSRQPGWGPDWEASGPGIRDHAVASTPRPLAVGGLEVTALPRTLATGTYGRPSGDEVLGLRLEVSGHGRARWSDGTEVVVAGGRDDRLWCLTTPCVCPDGTAILGWEPLPAEAGELTVALTGAAEAEATATIEVEHLCEEPTPDEPEAVAGDGPLLGTWRAQPSAMQVEVATLFADMEASATWLGGFVLLTFRADGTVDIDYDQVTMQLEPGDGLPGLPLEVTGGGTLPYSIDGSTMRFGSGDYEVVFRLAGVDGQLPIDQDDVSSAPSTAIWGINSGTLTLQSEVSDVFLPNQYRKP